MTAIPFTVLLAISWVFTGLAILLTAGRYWIRCKIIKKLAWDDAAHLLGLLLLIAQVSIISAAASMIYQTANYPKVNQLQYEVTHPLFIRLNVAGVLVTWFCLYAIKFSFMLLYHRIFQISQRFIQAWWIVLGSGLSTFLILIAGSITECGSPLDLENAESCLAPSMTRRQSVFVLYSCALNVFSDLTIMALPLMMLKGLQMRMAGKVALAGVFSCAFITIAFDILRAVETEERGGVIGSTALWTNLESAVAVIVSCLPSFAALFRPKGVRNDRNRSPYKQRSLAVSDSAKLYLSPGRSVKSGCDGHTSAAAMSENSLATSSISIPAPVTEKSPCKGGLGV